MKTSILISSFAALCLLITFAEAPKRRSSDNGNGVSSNHFSYSLVSKAVSSDKTAILLKRTKTNSATPETTNDDFSYLKFNADDYYLDLDADLWEANEAMPDPSHINFEYLKFEVSHFYTQNESPETDGNSETSKMASSVETATDYLKFDVNRYTQQLENDITITEELPINDEKALNPDIRAEQKGTGKDLDYLKFNVNDFYTPGYEFQFYEEI